MLVEATLDFPEEEIEFLEKSDAIGQLQGLRQTLDAVLKQAGQGALLRDGLKFRDRPKAKQAGSSIAALTSQKRGGTTITSRSGNQLSDLEQKAKSGDRVAQDNLLVAKMNALRSQRGGR